MTVTFEWFVGTSPGDGAHHFYVGTQCGDAIEVSAPTIVWKPAQAGIPAGGAGFAAAAG